jgi:uncharacterized lipoprotein YddW (UPF0748 family)
MLSRGNVLEHLGIATYKITTAQSRQESIAEFTVAETTDPNPLFPTHSGRTTWHATTIPNQAVGASTAGYNQVARRVSEAHLHTSAPNRLDLLPDQHVRQH